MILLMLSFTKKVKEQYLNYWKNTVKMGVIREVPNISWIDKNQAVKIIKIYQG